MGFQEAVRTVLSKYATFTGRAARPEFWWFALFSLLAHLVASFLDGLLFGQQLIDGLLALALLLPSLAVGARRLHDIGRSGWWLLISLIPVVGWLVLIYFYVQPGEPSDNQFGPRPAA